MLKSNNIMIQFNSLPFYVHIELLYCLNKVAKYINSQSCRIRILKQTMVAKFFKIIRWGKSDQTFGSVSRLTF